MSLVLANNDNTNGNANGNGNNPNTNTTSSALALTTSSSNTTTTSTSTKPSSQQLTEQQRKKKEQMEREKKLQLQKQGASKQKVDPKKAPPKPPNAVNGDINLLKKESEFLCSLQFRNTLPDIPFEPKLLTLPLDPSRFVKFSTHNTLERVYKQQIWPEPDLGIPISLIDPAMYKTPEHPIPIPPEDSELIRLASDLASGRTQRRMETLRPHVPWLKKTTYLSTEQDEAIKFGRPQKQAQQSNRDEDNKTLDQKIEIINKSFELASNIPTRHPLLKPDVKLVSVLPIIPDIELYPTEYAEIIFDSDPLDINVQDEDNELNTYKRSRALFKPIADTSFCDYFVHSVKETPDENRGMEDGDQYEQVRSFRADVVDNIEVKDNYFFVEKNGALHYNPLKIRVRARKVKFENEEFFDRPSKLKLARIAMREEDEEKRKKRADIIGNEEEGW
eukprot:TRINITY_DN12_c0_g1_i1.p1 TRINITY_DN12_c0_g1~~TRINITY_DN12_c0_g1_i1.p1  ORF type:complete len:447 (+),score=115.63 TRINITY_DN12_c0_g1_i1:370-1710(+)